MNEEALAHWGLPFQRSEHFGVIIPKSQVNKKIRQFIFTADLVHLISIQ
jgi:hypothetical protein